jgi:hypothetical protein
MAGGRPSAGSTLRRTREWSDSRACAASNWL